VSEDSGRHFDAAWLVAAAQRLVGWANEAVLVPHSDHDEPSAHADCVICRAMVLLPGLAEPAARDRSPAPTRPEVTWIPVSRVEGAGSAAP
jgi:hypothetical protein